MPFPGRQASCARAARAAYWRAALALLLFSTWMALLFAGFLFGGALHLLLPAAAALFPWRWLAPPLPPLPAEEPADERRAGRPPERG
jgi:fatty acid desaturase